MPTPLALLPPDLAREAAVVNRAARVLLPWQKEFARWMAERRWTNAEKLAKLFDLTGDHWTYPRLRALLDSGLFREYVGVMRERGLRAARERLGEVAYEAVEGLAEGIAHTRAEQDYGTMSKLTGQILERAMPRRDDLQGQRVTVNIALNERQQALESAPIIDVEYEEVPSAPK